MNKQTKREVILSMLDKGMNRNYVEMLARESGEDFDHIRGYDEGEFKSNNKENE